MLSKIVTSKDNPEVKLAAALLRSKKERDEAGLFVCEGLRLCLDAAESGVKIRTLLLTPEHSAMSYEKKTFLHGKARTTLLLDGPAAARLGDTKTPQGIFAICEKLDNRRCAVTIKRSGHFLLLENIQDPGNLGAMLRTADALGVSGVFFGPGCADMYSPKVLRASMGGLFRLSLEQAPDLKKTAASLRGAGVPVWAAALRPDATRVGTLDFFNGGAVAIGNEGGGLTPELIAACTGCINIPMADGANSLNAAVAAGILLWEMRRSRFCRTESTEPEKEDRGKT